MTSSVFFVGGIVVFFGLVPTPKEVGLPEVDSEEKEDEETDPISGMNIFGNKIM